GRLSLYPGSRPEQSGPGPERRAVDRGGGGRLEGAAARQRRVGGRRYREPASTAARGRRGEVASYNSPTTRLSAPARNRSWPRSSDRGIQPDQPTRTPALPT